MTLIGLILVLMFLGFIVWLVTQAPMPPLFRYVIIFVAGFFVLIMVLQMFGANTSPMPNLRLW